MYPGSAGTAGSVTLGPDSMGAAPGPGLLRARRAQRDDHRRVRRGSGSSPRPRSSSGKRTLDVDRARAALDKHVGANLGVDTDAAARAVVEAAWDAVAQLARATAEEAGWDPADVTVYGYGGNGPLFATAVADRLGASAVPGCSGWARLSAYGSAISDVVHVYESAVHRDEPWSP